MTDLKATLYDFWARFDMPAYLQDSVPEVDADGNALEPPYITYEVTRPSALSALPLTAIAWFPGSVDGNMRRTAFQDQVELLIPEGGIMLPVGDDGFIILDRNPSGFVSDYQDQEEPSIIGARVSYLVRYYI